MTASCLSFAFLVCGIERESEQVPYTSGKAASNK